MANERLNLSMQEVLDIVHGGTGASTAEEARAKLDTYAKEEVDTKLNERVYGFLLSLGDNTSITFKLPDALNTRFGLIILYTPNGIETNMKQVKLGAIHFNEKTPYSNDFNVNGDPSTGVVITDLLKWSKLFIISPFKITQ